MSDIPRYTINRTLVVVRLEQPFLDWLTSVDPTSADLELGELNEDGDAFLIPGEEEMDDEDGVSKWIESRWEILFEHMLTDWIADEALWPQNRSLKMFRQWFSVERHSMVWDLCDTPLEVEDWADEDDTQVMLH